MQMLQLNTVGLHKVMQDFYILTKLRIVIFDAQFHELMAYPKERVRFCELLRQTPKGEMCCASSDQEGCLKCARLKTVVAYKCHLGLTEVVVPIIDKGGVIAYVMFGQIIPKETCEETKLELKNRTSELSHEIETIPIRSQKEISAAATVLQAITAYVMTNQWVIPNKSEFIREIDHYIEEHLAETITVDEICGIFHVGRTKMYELSVDYLGCGLAAYIRSQRIFHAQRLLVETDMAVTQISDATGFADYNHFSRVFKEITGISAREYRKSR